MQHENNWSSRLQQALQQALKDVCGSQWGYHISNNWGLEADIVEAFDTMPLGGLQLQKREVTSQGIEIYVSAGEAIMSLPDLSRSVFNLLYSVGETLFLVLPMLDTNALRYWFVIGSPSHGHIGEVIIWRENIPHIDLSVLDQTMAPEEKRSKN